MCKFVKGTKGWNFHGKSLGKQGFLKQKGYPVKTREHSWELDGQPLMMHGLDNWWSLSWVKSSHLLNKKMVYLMSCDVPDRVLAIKHGEKLSRIFCFSFFETQMQWMELIINSFIQVQLFIYFCLHLGFSLFLSSLIFTPIPIIIISILGTYSNKYMFLDNFIF